MNRYTNMKGYTIFCNEKQTKKALELGAPIEILPNYTEFRVFPLIKCKDGNERPYVLPTAEQMLGWLRKEMKLAISIDYTIQNDNKPVWFYSIFDVAYSNTFSEPEEATLAAIDAALDYLTNKKQ